VGFALLAMVAQLAIVFADYYWNDEELGRLFVEEETQRLSRGLHAQNGRIVYDLPMELRERYSKADTGYFARVRTPSGTVLYSACPEECRDHLLPIDLRPPSFWMRILAQGKPLTLAGGATVDVSGKPIFVEMATLGDPDHAIWSVLREEVTDHMLVPMSLFLLFVLGGTLLSIRSALVPVRRAAQAAERLDPADTRSHLDAAGMPLEVAQLADAVNRAFARVGELMQAQRMLTSAVAHEVRTPLAIIKLELERIDDPRARKAERDLDELVDFVAQLTALARLESTEHSAFQPTDLEQLTEDLVQGIGPWVYRQGHSIAFERMGSAVVLSLEGLLRDAVRNLIENAVRHTPAGTTITVSIEAPATIVVADDGGGYEVPAGGEDLALSATRVGGIGIGLEIVRRITGLLGAKFASERTSRGMRVSIAFDAVIGQ
jgi:signal transduction histidine kinase